MSTMVRLLILVLSWMPLASYSFGQSSSFVGVWEIEPDHESSTEFPWWNEIKYPIKLKITKEDGKTKILFEDQNNFVCVVNPLLVNQGSELVFGWCGNGGTKHLESWSPIHHVKVVSGELIGVVSTSQMLFKWKGQRTK